MAKRKHRLLKLFEVLYHPKTVLKLNSLKKSCPVRETSKTLGSNNVLDGLWEVLPAFTRKVLFQPLTLFWLLADLNDF